ncbi:hypothetical protein [Nostoc sp.]
MKTIRRLEVATTQALVHLRGLRENQGFETHAGGFACIAKPVREQGVFP